VVLGVAHIPDTSPFISKKIAVNVPPYQARGMK
jgi:hypothetical protein